MVNQRSSRLIQSGHVTANSSHAPGRHLCGGLGVSKVVSFFRPTSTQQPSCWEARLLTTKRNFNASLAPKVKTWLQGMQTTPRQVRRVSPSMWQLRERQTALFVSKRRPDAPTVAPPLALPDSLATAVAVRRTIAGISTLPVGSFNAARFGHKPISDWPRR